MTVKELRMFVNNHDKSLREDAGVQINLTTKFSSRFVDVAHAEIQDDGSLTLVVRE